MSVDQLGLRSAVIIFFDYEKMIFPKLIIKSLMPYIHLPLWNCLLSEALKIGSFLQAEGLGKVGLDANKNDGDYDVVEMAKVC